MEGIPKGWPRVVVTVACGLFWLVVLWAGAGLLAGLIGWHSAPDTPIPDRTPSDSDTQNYLYCWDSGPPDPHHLGYYVASDHLCTYGELKAATPGFR